MGWIIFVFVLLIVLSSMRSRAAKARKRMNQQPALLQAQAGQPVQNAQSYQTAQSMQQPRGRVFQPGNSTTYNPGDSATYRPGNSPTYPPGDAQTYKSGNAVTYQPGDSTTYAPGDAATYAPGDSPTFAAGNSPTYAPATQLGSRPVVTPPSQQRAPRLPPTPARDGDTAFQPTYASLTEMATAWRDQAVIDMDRRNAARTAPEQAPYQGSTAVSSTSLNTTLVTPYQPSSLITSLSSSLSSSLTDSPPRTGTTSAFGEVDVISLPGEVVAQVRFHLRNGHEVEAVRLVCDTMNVGLLEATKTVRSYA